MNFAAKAAALASAWAARLGRPPTKTEALLALAPAYLETFCGDAGGVWEGMHNWGGLQLTRAQGGLLTDDEEAVLTSSGITPTSDDMVAQARAFVGHGIAPRDHGALVRDSYPSAAGQVPYWVFFWC